MIPILNIELQNIDTIYVCIFFNIKLLQVIKIIIGFFIYLFFFIGEIGFESLIA